jgi:NADPH-dependent 2,4-dienoyl-CoA reductase/sulfur reductase-like enzyme
VVSPDGYHREQGDLTLKIEFEGETLEAHPGESLAATLTAHGIRSFRTTERGSERGLFCGMGVCQDCLLEVDGRPNQRACTLKVDRPMKVRREASGRTPPAVSVVPSRPPITIEEIPIKRPEVLVIGAGPGGLAAAHAARLAGAEVLVLDEGSAPGGQYFKQCSATDVVPPDAQHREGGQLIDDVLTSGVTVLSNALVWGAFPPLEFAVTMSGSTFCVQPHQAIVATGAYDRGWPVPGWTLPGVMTAGAAQTMWRTARRLPGKRVLIAGNGPLNLQLASELVAGGADVVAVVEAAPTVGLRRVKEIAAMLATAPGLVADGIRHLSRCRRAGVRMISESVLTSVAHHSRGLLATIDGRETAELESDVVCLGYGFHPSNELLRGLGCSHVFDPEQRRLATVRDARGATTVAGVWALGDCTRLGGARVGLAEGTLAGLAAARALARPLSAKAARLEAQAEATAARHRRFQRALWRVYRMEESLFPQPAGDTVICRCEEISYGQVEEALAEGATSPREVKQRTRIGMGRCQARYCGPALEAFLAERTGRPPDEYSGFAPRVPIKPVRVADLANPLDV